MTDPRPFSPGDSTREPDAFRLHKTRCGHGVEAVCEVWREAAGWRVQVVVSDTGVKWTASVATDAEKRATIDTWRLGLVERGWA